MITTARNLLALTTLMTAACTAAVDPSMSGDDTGGGGGGGGTGSVRFVETTLRDERGDLIDFGTGEPVHAHAGAPTTVGGAGCPAVYKFAYLLDDQPPVYGKESVANPLEFQLELDNPAALDLSMAAYRVRAADDTILLDWTKLPRHDAGLVTIPMYRTGETSIPALGEREGELFLDVRTHDLAGAETITSACWEHHPLAAPLELEAARVQSPGLVSLRLAADAQISRVLNPSGMAVYEQTFHQHTAEPVQLVVELPQPTGTYSKRIADEILTLASRTFKDCGTVIFPSDEPGCILQRFSDPVDTTAAGALATGRWTVEVFDENTTTAMGVCTTNERTATCTIAPRAFGTAAARYRIQASVRDVRDLFPAPAGPFAEHALTFQGVTRTYTGVAPLRFTRCSRMVTSTDGVESLSCVSEHDYARIVALDTARLAFDEARFVVTTAPSTTVAQTPLAYVPAALTTIAPFVWDAGDDDLPGPQ